MATKKKTKVTSVTIRENAKKDLSPSWADWEYWSPSEYRKRWHNAMHYYNLQLSSKDIKPAVLKWMNTNDFTDKEITDYKATKDWRSSTTMGSIASCLVRGMPAVHETFNNGRDAAEWLRQAIADTIEAGTADIEVEDEDSDIKKPTQTITIQARVKEASISMCEVIEDAIDSWVTNAATFDPKAFKLINVFKAKETKAAHARIIKDIYSRNLKDLEELNAGKPTDETKLDSYEQLQEAYNTKSKKEIRNLLAFYKEIESACNMLIEESKVNKAPRVKKSVSKDKLVEKLKYLKTFEPLKLVSANPVNIIGASELWVYNTKNRKIGKYVADEFTGPLTVKGTVILGFDEHKSVQKSIRKPEEKIKEFKDANKIMLRKFLEDINATDTKLNGRINEDTILLKIS
jgi:hypothetical protein